MATCRRSISPAPTGQPARHSPADIIARAAIVLAAITALAGAVVLQERSDGLTFACLATTGAMFAWRLW